MSRAVRKPVTRDELQSLSLDELNATLKYLANRQRIAGSSAVGKAFRKEIAIVEEVRLKRFGVVPRRK